MNGRATDDDLAASYDAVPYTNNPFPRSHPDRLAMVARSLGLQPVPVQDCRVLELGCATGGNIIPMAEALPASRFIGIDVSARQIEIGNQLISQLGLTNIELRQRNLLDISPGELDTFDYIIAHGLYSWASADVRDRMLAICSAHLVDQGVAYISYNTLPGWGARREIRQMMLYHTASIRDPRDKVAQARALLNYLATSVAGTQPANKVYLAVLQAEIETIRSAADAYLLHDHLEPVNDPCYFHEFIAHAARHDLEFLAEAEPRLMLGTEFPPDVRDKLRTTGGILVREQYLDFLRNRMFRETLLVRRGAPIQRRGLNHDAMRSFYAAAEHKPDPADPARFVGRKGSINIPDIQAQRMLHMLAAAWPSRVRVEELLAQCSSEPSSSAAVELLQSLYSIYAVELYTRPIDFAHAANDRPVARPLARLHAVQGDQTANLRHERVRLTPEMRALIPLLDGSRGRAELPGRNLESLLAQLADAAVLVR